MISELDPDQIVPDAIYLSSLDHAVSSEEIAFREVLVFHRSLLSGGLDLAIDQLADTDPDLARIIQAYRAMGISPIASLLEEAAIGSRSEEDLGELADRYVQLAYGDENGQSDAVESAAIRYAQLHAAAFGGIAGAAARGDFNT